MPIVLALLVVKMQYSQTKKELLESRGHEVATFERFNDDIDASSVSKKTCKSRCLAHGQKILMQLSQN